MEQLVRTFLLKELHSWEHESALVEYLHQHPRLCGYLNFESVPDQSTLWRTWHQRFTPDLRETIETAARSILIQADRTDVSVPREPPERYWAGSRESERQLYPTYLSDTILSKSSTQIGWWSLVWRRSEPTIPLRSRILAPL
uniref:transposase n=1 Tax=Halococcus morrhuae TaxID=2250 RepID=UPI0009B5C4B1